MSTLIGFNDQGFIEKPETGWLHEDADLVDGNSITYSIDYVGMVPVFESINSWKQDLRTELVREAIVRLTDHAQLLTANKKRKVAKKVQKALGAPSKQWGCQCKLAINIDDFCIKNGINNKEMFKHTINTISFASGGEGVTIDFVAYVGKDSRSGRGCHIFNCPRKAHLVLLTMGQAFDLSFRRFKAKKIQPVSVNQKGDNWGKQGPVESPYEESRGQQRSMAGSEAGTYDNFQPADPRQYEAFPQRRGPDSDLYGTSGRDDGNIYDNGMKGRGMKHSGDGIYDNGLGKGDGIYDNRPDMHAQDYESVQRKTFDDPLYESAKDITPKKDNMKYSDGGIYDNGLGTTDDIYDNADSVGGKGKSPSGPDEDLYGSVGGEGEATYDTAGGTRRGMEPSKEGFYDNPFAGKGKDGIYDNTAGVGGKGKSPSGPDEDLYGSVGGEGEATYDTAGGARRGMEPSKEGFYDNPFAGKGKDGIYDNTEGVGGKGKSPSGPDEDIYGGVGGEGEATYDTAGGARRGMEPSNEGFYDNPFAGKGKNGIYDNPAGGGGPVGRGKSPSGPDEDIYGGVGGEGEATYDTVGGARIGMEPSKEGFYDNPLAGGKGKNGIYDNPAGGGGPVGRGKSPSGPDEDIYGGVGGEGEATYDTAGGTRRGMEPSNEGFYDNPSQMQGKDPLYGNPKLKRKNNAVVKGNEVVKEKGDGLDEDIYSGNDYEDMPDEPEEGIYGGIPGSSDNPVYDNPKELTEAGKSPTMAFTGDGIYDNPEAVKGGEPLYDNPSGTAIEPQNRLQQPRKKAQFDQSIYSKTPGLLAKGGTGPKEKWPLIHQPWFHGRIQRIEAEAILQSDGDFFVRESSKKPGQFVLTAMAAGKPQHLLLVDGSGQVKAKDTVFATVAELVYSFQDKGLPLYIDRTAVYLKTPVSNVFPLDGMDRAEPIYQDTSAS